MLQNIIDWGGTAKSDGRSKRFWYAYELNEGDQNYQMSGCRHATGNEIFEEFNSEFHDEALSLAPR